MDLLIGYFDTFDKVIALDLEALPFSLVISVSKETRIDEVLR